MKPNIPETVIADYVVRSPSLGSGDPGSEKQQDLLQERGWAAIWILQTTE